MKVSIVVLNYNGLQNTLDCVESLKKLNKDDNEIKIVVVDNASSDGSKEKLSGLKGVELLINDQNLGYSGGNNVGIKHAIKRGADAVLILNNDTYVDTNLITSLVDTLKNADIICPKIYFAPGFEFHKKRYSKKDLGNVIWYAGGHIDWANILGRHDGVDEIDKGQFSKSREIDMATGAALFVKREVFEKIGYFDEKYFLYLEDMDFCVRAKKSGFKIIFEPKAVLWHKNAGSSSSGSQLQDYYITRNRLLFSFKHAQIRTKLAVFRDIASKLNQPTKRKAFIDFLMLKFGKGFPS
ncbi:MAG TPA: glycosyltransferase family 2 protein [Candidatus Saccharimonadales bacterium]|nr:glycosyltransferase family 2 protein [Candidatus Saccharimonadales bacterium]